MKKLKDGAYHRDRTSPEKEKLTNPSFALIQLFFSCIASARSILNLLQHRTPSINVDGFAFTIKALTIYTHCGIISLLNTMLGRFSST